MTKTVYKWGSEEKREEARRRQLEVEEQVFQYRRNTKNGKSVKWFRETKNYELIEKTREEMINELGEYTVKKAEEDAKKNYGMKVTFYRGKGITQRTYFATCKW